MELCRGASRAETIAHAFLTEGTCSLWSAVREVVRDLGYAADRRIIADGYIFRLGLYNKGGLVGLTSETKHHRAVCQLLNTLVIATLGTHRWTSLSVNMNCSTEVHKDQCNASEDHLQSLQIGLSHYDQGELWIEDPKGCVYLEHHRDGLLRGSAHNTQATASLFHAQKHYHATLLWNNGDRVVLIAYVARQHACAVQRYGGILEEAGFVLPHREVDSVPSGPNSPVDVAMDLEHSALSEPRETEVECLNMESSAMPEAPTSSSTRPLRSNEWANTGGARRHRHRGGGRHFHSMSAAPQGGGQRDSPLFTCQVEGCVRRYRKGYHKHCCGLCTVGHHTARCDKEWRKVQLMPLRGQISECVTAGCCRIAGYSHVHCCTDCVQSEGQLHTGTCQRRQDLAYVVAGTASSSVLVPDMEAAGMSGVATTARSPAAMTALSSRDNVPSRDAVASSTESKPQSVKGTEAVEVSSSESSEESSGDFVLISVTGGATAKLAESASVAAETKSEPRYEAGSGVSLHMMD
ncbi:unnamed protein product [Symbiodinium microadriaticum]|nr:unnamed protein product [Symbiodinium microadriaticum]